MNARAALLDALPPAEAWPLPPQEAEAIPMQTPAWLHARAALVPRDALRLFAVHDAQGVAALAPLQRQGPWLRELPAMFEPSDLCWRTPEALAALARALVRQRLPLALDRLPAQSPTLAALRQALAGRGLLRVQEAMPTPVIPLAACREAGEAAFGARRRADFRRYERRAAQFGPLRLAIHAPAPGAPLQHLLAQALAVESRSWKQAAGTALTAEPVQGGFFVRFTEAAAAAGQLRIALAHVGERPVAMQIATQWRRRWWLFKISHDQALASCSPGQLLMRHTLLHAAREGLETVEMMGVMDDWTRLWTPHTRRYLRVQALPFGAASAQLLLRRAARAGLDRLRRPRG